MKVKGFTLIELLAVIVILAIIALIATPIILNVIGDTKKSSVLRGAELYIDTVEKEIARLNLKEKFSPETCIVEKNGNITCNEEKTIEIDMKGNKPTCGEITFEKGKVASIKSLILDGQELETDSNGNIINKGASTGCKYEPSVPQGTYLSTNYLMGKIDAETIITITVVNHKNVPSGVPSWDASEAQDGSVMAWYTEVSSSRYNLYIGGEGGVKANPNSSGLFYEFSNLTTADLKHLDTSDVTNMSAMFNFCRALSTLDLSGWNTSKVINMQAMFLNCSLLKQIIGIENFDTSNVTNMSMMFSGCPRLLPTLDLSNWDTSKVTDVSGMFTNCSSLKNIDLRNAVFTNVTSYSRIFNNCSNLTTVIVKDEDAKTWINSKKSGVAKLPSEV